MQIDASRFIEMISGDLRKGLTHAAMITTRKAQERAPVRKVFKGGKRRKRRTLTGAELAEEARDYGVMAAPGQTRVGTRTYENRRARGQGWHQTSDLRELKRTKKGWTLAHRQAKAKLNAQGRYLLQNARQGKIKNFGISLGPGRTAHLGGSLRKSIHYEIEGDTTHLKARIIAGGPSAPYARFVEFGTRHAPAQPFLRPARAFIRQRFKGMLMASLRHREVKKITE